MPNETPPPGEYIREEMKSRGWTQDDLARILERPLPTVNRILNGKHAIMPDMAIALGAAFNTAPDLWMARESAYRLSLATGEGDDVRRRAKLYEIAPIKEMQKRGWISGPTNAQELEAELLAFFDVQSLEDENLQTGAVMRRTHTNEPLTPGQRAWCYRVRQIARGCLVADFRNDQLDACKRELRRIAAYPQEAYRVSRCLGDFGIRFVVVEPLASTKVDGVAMWLSPSSPVLGMSLRYDRVDSFWHTLCHEISHIAHRDEAPLDSDLTDQMEGITIVKSEMERRADEEAAEMLVPSRELKSFILRVGPLYSKERIVQFAHRMKMHPGVIVGQLQHRQEIGYRANREMLAKIRHFVTAAAFTDGWGHSIDSRNLR